MAPFIDPMYAGAVPFERLTDEANGVWTPLLYQPPGTNPAIPDTPAVVSLSPAAVQAGNGPRYSQGGTVFVPRELDRRHGDRFTHSGTKYRLVGGARGDQDHPITGDDFGWVAFSFVNS